MNNMDEIAHAFRLKPVRSGYHGACPVCGYPSGFSLREKHGKLLCYCHTGRCRWEEIRRAFQSKGFFQENRGAATVAIVATVAPRLKKTATAPATGCYSQTTSDYHFSLWSKSLPAKGTPVEVYLRSRGISISSPGTIRYLPQAFHTSSGQYFPAMLARVDHVRYSQPIGVHRTFLKPDGSGKALVEANKMMLGKVQGGSVHLADPTDMLAITEGIETGLSVQQATGIPTWAALSCGGMRNLVLPIPIQNVLIFADADQPGLRAAYDAAERHSLEGKHVKVLRPAEWNQDFNDLLRRPAF